MPSKPKPLKSGVYALQNTVTGMVYVGATSWFSKRKWGHLGDLRRGTHYIKLLQQDFNTYGEDAFEFSEVERIPVGPALNEKEREYIRLFERLYGVYNTQGSSGEPPPMPSPVYRDEMWEIENPEPIWYPPPHEVYTYGGDDGLPF